MKKTLYILLILTAIAVAGSSCKKGSTTSLYVVKPQQVVRSYDNKRDSIYVALEGTKGYAFHADTAQWEAGDYDQAVAGVICSRTGSETMQYTAAATIDENGYLNFTLDYRPVILVVVDPSNSLFGWRHAELDDNLDRVTVPIRFNYWKEPETYIDSRWNMVNTYKSTDYTPPPTPEPTPEPTPTPTP